MIFQDALAAIPRRARRPVIISLSAGFFLFNVGAVALSAWAMKHLPPSAPRPPDMLNTRFVLSALLGCVFSFIISPFSWQWTGDGKRIARPGRGILQAVGLHLLYSLFNLSIVWPNIRLYCAFMSRSAAPRMPPFLSLLGLGVLLGCGFSVILSFALAFWEAKTAEKEQAMRQAEEARWNLLKAQMSPHVLLNSLNGLAELVREDTAAAVKGMQDLAEIYRQLLTMGEAPAVPLKEERRLLERYLDVEKLRLGEALRVEWDWDPGLDALPAMPLLLQPLVENAIKHGVAADPHGGLIRVSGHRDGRQLVLTVSNTGQAPVAPQRRSTGVGLRNLKSRLELAYGGKAAFDLVREAPWTRAELKLPMEDTP